MVGGSTFQRRAFGNNFIRYVFLKSVFQFSLVGKGIP